MHTGETVTRTGLFNLWPLGVCAAAWPSAPTHKAKQAGTRGAFTGTKGNYCFGWNNYRNIQEMKQIQTFRTEENVQKLWNVKYL